MYNYWGSYTGPKGESIGGLGNGRGDIISKNIVYEPYLTCSNIQDCSTKPLSDECIGLTAL